MKTLFSSFRLKRALLCFILTYSFSLNPAFSQERVLYNLNNASGDWPEGSLTLVGNKLYGMTTIGGANNMGCIFSMDTNGNNYKILLDFNDTNGSNPRGSLTNSGSVLYGMTNSGGIYFRGTIFSIDTNGTKFKTLLNLGDTNGSNPYGDLTLSGKTLYGMTYGGGVNGKGCIFSIDTNGSNNKILFNFNGSNGKEPYGDLTISGNKMYGMTYLGGAHDSGCIFSIDTDGGNYKTLFSFTQMNNGGFKPYGSLTLSGNILFGMVKWGGPNLGGCIFSIDTGGNGYKSIFNFNDIRGGSYPMGSLILSGDILYGMTPEHSGGFGSIFSIDTNGNNYIEYVFNSTNGWFPVGSLTISGNILYGMTEYGGISDSGVIFSFNDVDMAVNKIKGTSGTTVLYPNPNNGNFIIEVKSEEQRVKNIEVYNVLGEKVFAPLNPQSGTLRHSAYQLDLSGQPAGVYLYRAVGENGALVGEGKFVIEH
jgi:uncharacterized repeat protein (TIGR03803 family)